MILSNDDDFSVAPTPEILKDLEEMENECEEGFVEREEAKKELKELT